MSYLQFRYSEGYDASISGWTRTLDETYFNDHYDKWLLDYVEPAQKYVAKVQIIWDEINNPIFDSFRQFGYQFLDLWPAYAVHRWPGVVGFKDPLTFFVDDPIDDAVVMLTHELVHCHEDYQANRPTYENVKGHIFERYAKELIAVRYHILTVCVQWAVLRRVFPDRYQALISLSCRHPLLQRCAEILNNCKEAIDYSDPLSSLLKL
jgi:hypothetical protein